MQLEAEVKLRLVAARNHLDHGIAGEVDPQEAIHNCRRLLAAAERELRRAA